MKTQARWLADSGRTACAVTFDQTALTVDIDPAAGGSGEAPSPHDLLDAALASCTTLTLQLYIKRKGFDVRSIEVDVTHAKGADGALVMTRTLQVTGTLNDEQKASLLRIADACPVHKSLTGEIRVVNVEQFSAA